MFGIYRTFLAFLVVISHLWSVPLVGPYAVIAFFTLSGYLMTLIMHKNYGYTFVGISKYALNRFLRIFPLYWLSLLATIGLILWWGEEAVMRGHPCMFLPRELSQVLANVFLILGNLSEPRLTPPAWALTVELFFYLGIGLGLSSSKPATVAWFTASVLLHGIIYFRGGHWENASLAIVSLPFSTGAMLYHYHALLSQWIKSISGNYFPYMPPLLVGLLCFNWLACVVLEQGLDIYVGGLAVYVNFLLNAVLILVLSGITSPVPLTRKYDKWIGDLSYPVYLSHMQCGILTHELARSIGFNLEYHSLSLFLVSLPVVCVVSWGLAQIVEQPLEILRTWIKQRASVPQG